MTVENRPYSSNRSRDAIRGAQLTPRDCRAAGVGGYPGSPGRNPAHNGAL